MAAPNPTCPSFKRWRGVSNRNNQRVQEDAKPPVFAPKFNVYVPAELQDLLHARPRQFSPEDLEGAASAIKASDKNQWLGAVTAVRKSLSKGTDPCIDQVLKLGVLPRLVYMMTLSESPKLQLEAAWAVCNVASGTSTQCSAVVEAGVLPHAINLLSCEEVELREQTAWLLGNIAGDGAALRDACLDAGLLAPLLEAAKKEKAVKPLRQYIWLLLNITRFKPRRRNVLLEVLPTVAKHVTSSDDIESVADALSSLAHIADDCLAEVLRQARSAVERAGSLVNDSTTANSVVLPASKVLSALCTGDEATTQVVIDTGVLTQGYKRFLAGECTSGVLREVCFALSNIAAGTQDQATAINNADLLPLLCDMYKKGSNGDSVQREATWVLSNMATKGMADLANAVRQAGAVLPLADFVGTNAAKAKASDVGATVAAAEALLAMLRAAVPGSEDGGPNPAVVEYQEAGVYDILQSTLDRNLLGGKARTYVEKILSEFPPTE